MMHIINICDSLKEDALSVCNSIYKMNAKHSLGYLFNPTDDGKKVSTGMFCDSLTEINIKQWTYYIDFANYSRVYEII